MAESKPQTPQDLFTSEAHLNMVDHFERARAVLSHTLESLPNVNDAREVAYSKLSHATWLISAAEELLGLGRADLDRLEALVFPVGGNP